MTEAQKIKFQFFRIIDEVRRVICLQFLDIALKVHSIQFWEFAASLCKDKTTVEESNET